MTTLTSNDTINDTANNTTMISFTALSGYPKLDKAIDRRQWYSGWAYDMPKQQTGVEQWIDKHAEPALRVFFIDWYLSHREHYSLAPSTLVLTWKDLDGLAMLLGESAVCEQLLYLQLSPKTNAFDGGFYLEKWTALSEAIFFIQGDSFEVVA
jgi:hypothetical protein